MFGHHQGIQLADHGHRRAGSSAAGYAALQSGEGQSPLVGDPQFLELLRDQLGGLDLPESSLGVGQYLLGHAHDLLLALFDGLAGPLFQFIDCQLGCGHGL